MITITIFTRLSAAALFKFWELQMRRSIGGGAQSIKYGIQLSLQWPITSSITLIYIIYLLFTCLYRLFIFTTIVILLF
jgi:hypothetical protein